MGIERFFKTVQQQNITRYSVWQIDINKRIKTNILLIDFNSIVHVASQQVISELNRLYLDNILKNKSPLIYLQPYGFQQTPTRKELGNLDLDRLITQRVVNSVASIITELTVSDELKLVYLAIDGVPSKAKMIEQKNRRYLSEIVNRIKSDLLENNKGSMEKMYEYEKNRIVWDKANITPGTKYMHKLYLKLTSDKILNRFKKLVPSLEKWIVSSQYDPGEGEKKVINYIYHHCQPDQNVTIYSPDSDVTLLALLMVPSRFGYTGMDHLNVIRHNQQTNGYEGIGINILAESIHHWISQRRKGLDRDQMINEVVFLFTVFGNDFLPRIQSIDIRNDFNLILDRYSNIHNPIITKDDVNKRYQLHSLHLDEGGQLQKSYLSNHFINFSRLLKIFKLPMDEFIRKSSEQLYRIDKWLNGEKDILKPEDIQFIDRVHRGKDDSKASIRASLKKELQLIPYTKSIDDQFHQSKLRNLPYPMTDYHRQSYKLDQMLDEYTDKLNNYPLETGKITLDTNNLRWKAEKIEKEVRQYYIDHFKINDLHGEDMKSLVKDYLVGLQWVFEYYYNQYEDESLFHPSTWYYQHRMSPLLTQIYHYLRHHTITEKDIDLNQFKVNRIDYFSCLEQLIYVTPLEIDQAPEEYQSFLRNTSYIPDFNKPTEELLRMIDCRANIFLNKCHLMIPDPPISDEILIRSLRQIKLNDDTAKRVGNLSGDQTPFVGYMR